MSGIEREIIPDPRHIAKHLPETAQVQRLLRRGRAVHVFNDVATMEGVAQAIIERGEFTGVIRGYESTVESTVSWVEQRETKHQQRLCWVTLGLTQPTKK